MGKIQIEPYNRNMALEYAHKWAFRRNPTYLDFENIGGDCTNFSSQVIFAGSKVMNYKSALGWYYTNSYNRSPSWTGVNFLYNFLTQNNGMGPFAKKVSMQDIMPGDIIQLSFNGDNIYQHSLVVVQIGNPVDINNILIATHTINRDYYALSNYLWKDIRFIHIMGVGK
ncbi:MAG: amidase [Clostridiales bacterium GWE2_32_10]|nr:MAG: amidase [Clostridiales bacterium GWE2_32_10]